jgi:hypothetical protein
LRLYDLSIDPLLLADLADEQASLDQLLAPLPPDEWDRSTPAPGWTIAAQGRHLERTGGGAGAGGTEQ